MDNAAADTRLEGHRISKRFEPYLLRRRPLFVAGPFVTFRDVGGNKTGDFNENYDESRCPVHRGRTDRPAFAGTWVKGQGETIDAALANAVKVAEARVKSAKRGCVNGKQQNLTYTDIKGVRVWSIAVLVNNQNGSCGINANEVWVKETAKELAGVAIAK